MFEMYVAVLYVYSGAFGRREGISIFGAEKAGLENITRVTARHAE
jgi:hypothetical protein